MATYAVTSGATVFGVQIDDDETRVLVKRVVVISAIMATLVIIGYVISAATGYNSVVYSVIGIFFGLMVPCCGFYGARDRNRSLLNAFWICNAINVVYGALVLIINLSTAKNVSAGAIAVFVVCTVIAILLQALAALWGYQLSQKQYFVVVPGAGIPSTYVVQTQPVVGVPYATPQGQPMMPYPYAPSQGQQQPAPYPYAPVQGQQPAPYPSPPPQGGQQQPAPYPYPPPQGQQPPGVQPNVPPQVQPQPSVYPYPPTDHQAPPPYAHQDVPPAYPPKSS